MLVVIQANGKKNATEVIADHGFIDVFPDMGFYEEEKVYRRDGKYYEFAGWDGRKVKGRLVLDRIGMKEIRDPESIIHIQRLTMEE